MTVRSGFELLPDAGLEGRTAGHLIYDAMRLRPGARVLSGTPMMKA
jgi:hypothetical protein